MKSALLLLLAAVPLGAQNIQGDAVDAVTGAPLAGVYISLPYPSNADPSTARTDVAGHFSLALPVNNLVRLTLLVIRSGYLASNSLVSVKPGPGVTNLRISMTPEAVLSGNVVDEDGYPVASGQVSVATFQTMENGERRFSARYFATLNDVGEYRVTGLPAGTYYISASETGWDQRYTAQYLGGGLTPNEKNAIDLKSGEHRTLDGRIVKYEGVTVSGHVVLPPGEAVVLTPAGSPFMIGIRRRQNVPFDGYSISYQPDGGFTMHHIPPGSYTLSATPQGINGQLKAGDIYGEVPLEIGTSDLTDVALATHVVRPIDVAGAVVQMGGQPRTVTIHASGMNGQGATAQPDESGAFVLKGLLPGHYNLQVTPDMTHLPIVPGRSLIAAIAYPVSARLDGVDVLYTGFDLKDTTAGSLQIVMRPPILIAGKVVDASGNPAQSTMVQFVSEAGVVGGTGVTDAEGVLQAAVRQSGSYRIYVGDSMLVTDANYRKAHENDFPLVRIMDGENAPLMLRLPK